MSKILPTAIVIISIAASIVYFANGDIRRGIYWAAAATITASVTY